MMIMLTQTGICGANNRSDTGNFEIHQTQLETMSYLQSYTE